MKEKAGPRRKCPFQKWQQGFMWKVLEAVEGELLCLCEKTYSLSLSHRPFLVSVLHGPADSIIRCCPGMLCRRAWVQARHSLPSICESCTGGGRRSTSSGHGGVMKTLSRRSRGRAAQDKMARRKLVKKMWERQKKLALDSWEDVPLDDEVWEYGALRFPVSVMGDVSYDRELVRGKLVETKLEEKDHKVSLLQYLWACFIKLTHCSNYVVSTNNVLWKRNMVWSVDTFAENGIYHGNRLFEEWLKRLNSVEMGTLHLLI